MSTIADRLDTAAFPEDYADIPIETLGVTAANFLSVKDALDRYRRLDDDQADQVMRRIAEREGVAPPEGPPCADAASALLVPSGGRLIEGKLYLQLYHGRDDPAREMQDWGFDGPTFGPLNKVVQTYTSTIRLHGHDGNEELWLGGHGDMIVWDGAYYGDLCIFVAGKHDRG